MVNRFSSLKFWLLRSLSCWHFYQHTWIIIFLSPFISFLTILITISLKEYWYFQGYTPFTFGYKVSYTDIRTDSRVQYLSWLLSHVSYFCKKKKSINSRFKALNILDGKFLVIRSLNLSIIINYFISGLASLMPKATTFKKANAFLFSWDVGIVAVLTANIYVNHSLVPEPFPVQE